MEFRSVFLDVGETLVGFRPMSFEKLVVRLRKAGYPVTAKQVFRAVTKVMGKSNFPNQVGLNPVDVGELLYELGIYPSSQILGQLGGDYTPSQDYFLYEDAKEFLEYLNSKGVDVVLITNATRRMHDVIDSLGIKKYVKAVIASCDVGVVKPHPRIFRYALNYVAQPAIHIGDIYELDYIGAKRAGLESLLLDRFGFYEDVKVNKVRNLYEAMTYLDKQKLLV
ncbi:MULTISPECIES: HAD family hydrolase [Metallosphaera]|nr:MULTISPECIES: HAD family hydrolase [Metallosphaera]AKV74509.1 2-haloalkanoic acid dehalogenase [Metallosphaera sedula]AKV76748.1 2-haloalkanoic acid dehalogenase [Metallosphaera sedula]AKV78999.1 2-haloalkanoic acid dehalogenase [Metallosphaera sedula]AKV81244.1 2-haloalkanoic acid dehalogenase [Metallosphaera sedula]AKV83483.1 2-haloalkanoic acid dehalogenase [Metallosphaera sedula]